MEEENQSPSKNLSHLLPYLSQQNLLLVSRFLDDETVDVILQNCEDKEEIWQFKRFMGMISSKKFICRYLNYSDKSTYNNLYCQDKFIKIESLYIKSLFLNGYGFSKIQKTMKKIKKGFQKSFNNVIDGDALFEYLVQTISEPFCPQINLKRGNVGMFCNSGFQFYLVSKRFPNNRQKFIEEICQSLNSSLEQLQLDSVQNNNMESNFNLSAQEVQRILSVGQFWYKINSDNFQQFLIQRDGYISTVHNSMVYLILFFDSFIESIDLYLQAFSSDLVHHFIEFNVRYSIFRNILLQIQNQFVFLFQKYNTIQQTMRAQRQGTKFKSLSAWHCLLSKWYLYMKHRHDDLNLVYCVLLKKLNFKQFFQTLQQNNLDVQQHMICLENNFQLKETQIIGSIVVQLDTLLTQFIEEDNDLVHQILKEFSQYIVDLSINEDSVHWCGYSKHQLHIPYQNHEEIVIQSLNHYFNQIYAICHKIDQSLALFEQIVRKVFYQLDKEYLKPATLRKMIDQVNLNFDNLSLSPKMLKSSNKSIKQTEKLEYRLVDNIYFEQNDRRLEYYNNEAKIPSKFDYSHNIVIENEDFNFSLKKSSNTNSTLDSYISNLEDNKFFDKLFQKTQSCDIQI